MINMLNAAAAQHDADAERLAVHAPHAICNRPLVPGLGSSFCHQICWSVIIRRRAELLSRASIVFIHDVTGALTKPAVDNQHAQAHILDLDVQRSAYGLNYLGPHTGKDQ